MSVVSVIGAGSWGTAFSGVVAEHADEVRLWCHSPEVARSIGATRHNPRYLVGYELPQNVVATPSLAEATRGCDACVLALPSTHIREVCREIGPSLPTSVPVVTLTKGIEPESGKLMTEVAADELGAPERMAALSGPNHAEEVCLGVPSAAVIAANDLGLARSLRSRVCTSAFRVYVSPDVRGVEVCGAVKNVVAIASGICVGMGFGDNTLALLMTRGVAEMGRVAKALGGDPITCMGLAGMGDLVATCTSEHSRNRRFGEAFVKGCTLAQFESETHMVVEGAHAVVSVRELAARIGVEAPIADAVWSVVYEGASPYDMASALMDREPTEEFYGMGTWAKGEPEPRG